MAPCFVADVPDWSKGIANSSVFHFQEKGIYAINGPNWEQDLKTIRKEFGLTVWGIFKKITGS